MARERDFVEGDLDPRIEMTKVPEHDPVSSIEDVLQVLDETSTTNREKGDKFEMLVASFLRFNPEHKSIYETVMKWSEWPTRPTRRDIGVDLIARRREDGELVAIQCKFKGINWKVGYEEVASFLVAASLSDIKRLVLVVTTDLTEEAQFALDEWSELMSGDMIIEKVGLEMFRDSWVDWSRFDLAAPVNMVLKDDHQLGMFETAFEGGRLRI